MRRVMLRSALNRRRADKPDGCSEKLDREFLKFLHYVWQFDRVTRPGIEAVRLAVAPQVPVVRLRDRDEMAGFLRDLADGVVLSS
ncbi:topology modulation protein [compost metagenome]